MTERSYGYLHDTVESGWAPEIAKRIRAEIKVAIAEGLLPAEPTYSVTSETYSGGQSINVTVRGWADAWVPCDGSRCHNHWCKAREDRPGAQAHDVLSEHARAAKITLERIHGAYNHDGSDVQSDYFDVRYYGQVQFETVDGAAWRVSEAARKKAKRAAIAERPKRRVANVTRAGRVVHDAVEDAKGRLVFACSGRIAGFSTWGAEGQDLTCSRCVKGAAR